MKRMILLCLLLPFILLRASSAAYVFSSLQDENQFWQLLARYRCVVCQNQSIKDSDARIAKSMRDFIYHAWTKGFDQESIDAMLEARYGAFVLERPPLVRHTWPLWGLPCVLLLLGAMLWHRFHRRALGPYNADVDD